MKKFSILLAVAFTLLLSACSKGMFKEDNKNLTPQQVTCKRLYRQMIYNRHSNNVQAKFMARSQNDRLKQLYKENECDKHR